MKSIRTILQNRFPDSGVAVQHFEKLLIDYLRSDLAPPNMVAELTNQDDGKFWAHVWEALLYNHFHSLKFEFIKGRVKKSGQKGPDFGIICSNKTTWVEAVVPAPQGIPLEYLEPPSGKGNKVPHDQKLLRWTSTIKDKRDKIAQYIEDGIISEDDCVVIAVNSCRLQDFAFEDTGISRFPYAVEATFPIGPLAVSVNRQGQQVGPAQNIWRSSVLKENGAKVPTDNFLNQDYNAISAVLGTHQREVLKNHLYLSLAHNPLAKNPLPKQLIGATKEFVCELGEEEFTLRDLGSIATLK